jgi:hypothetical protein
MLERDKVREWIAKAHANGKAYVSLCEAQEGLRGEVNANTVSGQIHYMHRMSRELEAAPEKRPQGHANRPVTVYRLKSEVHKAPASGTTTAIEVHVPTGWRRFEGANAWVIAEGTLRVMEVSPSPEGVFKRWIAVFPPGGWQGLAPERGAEERAPLGFRLRRDESPVPIDE